MHITSDNFYQIFQLPVQFNIDSNLLNERYQALQQVVHPDRHAGGTDKEKRLAIEQASLLNQAYQTLKNPLQRAQYLMQLKLGEPARESTVQDMAFLEQQIELRETLERAKESRDAALAASLNDQVDETVAAIKKQVALLIDQSDQAALQQLPLWISRWQFCQKFQLEVSAFEEKLLD